MFLRTRPGRGCQELGPPVCQKRSSRPDLDVYRSRFEPLSYLLGPLAVESPLLGYNDLLGGFEELDCIVPQGRQRNGRFSRERIKGV